MSFALHACKLCQHIEELTVHLFDAESFVGGAIDLLLKQPKVRGAKRFIRLTEQPSKHARVRPTDFLHHAVHVKLAQTERQRVGGRGFEMMTLVDDEVRILGQDFAARGNIRQKQCVIDDEHVSGLRRGLGAVEWTRAACTLDARFGRARIILRRQPRPHLTLGRSRKI